MKYPKFIQICAEDSAWIYALDNKGDVWCRLSEYHTKSRIKTHWYRLGMERYEDEPKGGN
jgi:hypothetical protein